MKRPKPGTYIEYRYKKSHNNHRFLCYVKKNLDFPNIVLVELIDNGRKIDRFLFLDFVFYKTIKSPTKIALFSLVV